MTLVEDGKTDFIAGGRADGGGGEGQQHGNRWKDHCKGEIGLNSKYNTKLYLCIQWMENY